ncbi:MAG TPA: sigma-70 family RNA polymerase sigma factor [Gemmatimonadaceae bacterium]|nr:sigma-70 family RNA polymerase sigma factor [Gemmatimonadaceae bacterium]
MDEPWIALLAAGDPERAWDALIGRYRRLIFSAIRHYASEPDDVMDVFACVCEALREDDFRRLRSYAAQPIHRARFGTWLVTVVRHLTIDWIRHRDGRRRLSAVAEGMPPLRRRIFELVFEERCSHVQAYETIRARDGPAMSFQEFLRELRATYETVAQRRRGHILRDLVPPPPEVVTEPGEDIDPRAALEMEEALGTLDAEDRLVLQLYVVDEVSAAAVARIAGLPNAKAVYNRVYRSLAVLRERLERVGVRREDL